MPAPTKNCGQHTELASSPAVRITRCACGTLHVNLLASGITVRMTPEVLRGVASGMKVALDRVDEAASFGSTSIN